jgi:hypothetical protein
MRSAEAVDGLNSPSQNPPTLPRTHLFARKRSELKRYRSCFYYPFRRFLVRMSEQSELTLVSNSGSIRLVESFGSPRPLVTSRRSPLQECLRFTSYFNDFTLRIISVNMTSPENIQQAAARHHGLPLLPRPIDDERDPLRWSQRLKLIALGATAFVNFTANFAGSGLSVAAPVLEVQFHKPANQVNALMTVSH